MGNGYAEWPFRSREEVSVQEAEQWWSGCYVPPAAALLAAAHPYWTIITGGPGSGKSVALAAMSRQLATSTFLIPYPTTRWPGGAYAWLKQADNHLEQMMAAASFALRDQFQQNPAQAANLPDLQKEFVRWLLQKVGGERAYHRWLQALPSEVAAAYDPIEYDDLFPNPNDPLDVQGQIDELVCLARTLGWEPSARRRWCRCVTGSRCPPHHLRPKAAGGDGTHRSYSADVCTHPMLTHRLTRAGPAPRAPARPSAGSPVPGTGTSAARGPAPAGAGSSPAGRARAPGSPSRDTRGRPSPRTPAPAARPPPPSTS